MVERGSNQYEVAKWNNAITPPHENTLRAKFDRGLEEVDELDKAITVFDGSRAAVEEVSGEIADNIIRHYGYADIIGVDIDKRVREKTMLTNLKYPPKEVNRLIAEGKTYSEAMAICKNKDQSRTAYDRRWNKRLLK